MKNKLVLFIVLFLLSCDAGTVEIRLSSIFETQKFNTSDLEDSITLNIKDTLYIYLEKSKFVLQSTTEGKKVLIKFPHNTKMPRILGDTLYLTHRSVIFIPKTMKVVIISHDAKVEIYRVNLVKGYFLNSELLLDTGCNINPIILEKSKVDFKIPSFCKLRYEPIKGAYLKSSVNILSFKVLKFKVDSAKFYLEEETGKKEVKS